MAAVDSLSGNIVGAGIKPQFTHLDRAVRERLQALWVLWTDEADTSSLADSCCLQAITVWTMIENGERALSEQTGLSHLVRSPGVLQCKTPSDISTVHPRSSGSL